MEKLTDFLTNPEWWSVIATFTTAVVAAYVTHKIGKRQNELIKQQIRQQEYDIYSQLYKLVKKADVEIDYYLSEITGSLGVDPWKKAKEGFLKNKLEYINQLRSELQQNALNFEIKFTKDFFDVDCYGDVLDIMIHNLKLLDKMVNEDKMIFEESNSQRIFNIDGSIEKGQAYYIAQHIKDKTYENIIGSNLLYFIEQRDKLRSGSNNILERIRERCKVE